MLNKNEYKVLLPEWCWTTAKDQQHLKKLVLQYMRHYPHYSVKSIKDGFAICERKIV
ncbi:hypothetical protein MXL46_08395 [Heyndrickxia sporothermodurans]|uniref:hypothetical protein n=1 Tax=Heyndrickxia sporothermodurans TaxID=46224 RepID=UPI002DBE2B76|nr:hypothetical protein [Heyndrickxia sporothermodurans]MEB6549115.1 hypothetical protein [Heyndrickxia sporothermodurans]